MKLKYIMFAFGCLVLIGIAYATTVITDTKETIGATIINYTTPDTSIKLYSQQHTAFGNNNGESLELWGLTGEAKPYIGWYGFDPASSRTRAIGWIGCHYNLTNGDVHQHCSWETLDNTTGTPTLNTKFGISYGSDITKSVVTISNSDLNVVNNIYVNISDGIKISPTSTLDIYPGGGSTMALRISNTTSKITMSALSSDFLQMQDHVEIVGSRMLILNANTTAAICNSTFAGAIYYDGTTSIHYGCNATAWKALY